MKTKIGLLFSLTGITLRGKKQHQAAEYALEEFNKHNNSGSKFEFVLRDIQSDPELCLKYFYELVELGIRVFVCWSTSVCRRVLLDHLVKNDCLLLFAAQYEGQEAHSNVFYTGEVPNQQVYCMIDHMVKHYGPNIYMLGSDYIFPRYTNEQAKKFLAYLGGTTVGEKYLPLGHSYFTDILQEIIALKPDCILTTLVGDNEVTQFYRAYYDLKLSPRQMPIFSNITTELEIQTVGEKYFAGHYSCESYFRTIDSPANSKFVAGFQNRFGSSEVISSYTINIYTGVYMLLNTIAELKTTDPQKIISALVGRIYESPSGLVKVDDDHHLVRHVRIAKANDRGQFEIVWTSERPLPAKLFVKNDLLELTIENAKEWKKVFTAWGELTTDAVMILDFEGQVLYANNQAADLLNVHEGELISSKWLDDKKDYLFIKEKSAGDNGVRIITAQQNVSALASPKNDLPFTFHTIETRNEGYKKELGIAQVASQTDANILLLGETGSGKEVLARAIHASSNRHRAPFIAVNVGAIPSELIASELFGYVEGAFTGAKRGGAIGKFQAAHHGTLFLDEIAEMSLEAQVVLLRALEERKVTRIGDHTEHPVDIRIIAATNRELKEEIVDRGSFRPDLFYRLNVFSVTIPPLRERTDDIEHIALSLLGDMVRTFSKGPQRFASNALTLLQRYSWPGNIRELRNVVERAFYLALTEKEIAVQHLPSELHSSKVSIINQTTLSNGEEFLIRQIIKESENLTAAAQKLGIARSTLYRKIKHYDIRGQ